MADPPMNVGLQPLAEHSVRFRRVTVRGELLPDRAVFLDNQAHGATPGYIVFMPLRIAGSTMHVLVKRGWIAAPDDRAKEPRVPTPTGEVEIEGLALPPTSRFLELSAQSHAGRVWQNVTLERIARESGLTFQPLILEQHSSADDGLERTWSPPSSGSAKHYGYAFQWGAMAVLIIILFVVLNVRRNASPPPAT